MSKLQRIFSAVRGLSRAFSEHPVTRTRPLAAWGRFLKWQIRSRLSDEVDVEWIAGRRLAVRRGMTGATGNIYVGLHEFADMMVVLHLLRPGDLFLDIGANIGSYTVLGAGVCGADVWAFEPDPETVLALRRNIALNDLETQVRVLELAAGDQSCDVAFTVGRDTTNRVGDAQDGPTRTIRQEPLDAILDGKVPVMIKADVEGHEEAVLRGADQLLAAEGLKAVAVETLTPWITSRMADAGFVRLSYDPFARSLSEGDGPERASNTLFIRDRDWVSDRLRNASPVEVLGQRI